MTYNVIVEFSNFVPPGSDLFSYEQDGEAASIAIRPSAIDRIDLDNDGTLGATDIDTLTSQIAAGDNSSVIDLTADGQVNRDDMIQWLQISGTMAGDVDLNQFVDLADFMSLATNFGTAGSWTSEDFDGDGEVRFPDFVTLRINFRRSPDEVTAVAAVPEPRSLLALEMALIVAYTLHRKRSGVNNYLATTTLAK